MGESLLLLTTLQTTEPGIKGGSGCTSIVIAALVKGAAIIVVHIQWSKGGGIGIQTTFTVNVNIEKNVIGNGRCGIKCSFILNFEIVLLCGGNKMKGM